MRCWTDFTITSYRICEGKTEFVTATVEGKFPALELSPGPPAPSHLIPLERHSEVVASGGVLLAGLPSLHSGCVSPSCMKGGGAGWVFLKKSFPGAWKSIFLCVHVVYVHLGALGH